MLSILFTSCLYKSILYSIFDLKSIKFVKKTKKVEKKSTKLLTLDFKSSIIKSDLRKEKEK
nr:MAG TPA: hypothetical protein [Caudoviricetes sp.]